MAGQPKALKKYWASRRKAKAGTTTMVKRKASRPRSHAKKTHTKRGGLGIGGMGFKGLLVGAALLTASKYAVNAVAPGIPFKKPLSAVAAGGVASVSGLPGKNLLGYGIMDGVSDAILGFIGGGSVSGITTGAKRYDL